MITKSRDVYTSLLKVDRYSSGTSVESMTEVLPVVYFSLAMADKPKHMPPHGMEPYDLGGDGNLGALSQEQQEKLNKFKVVSKFKV